MKTAKTRSTFASRALAASLALFSMAATPSFAASLAHRWSFNGNLNDSVGGANATTIKSSVSGGVIIPSPDPVRYVENDTAVQTGADQYGTYATSLNLGTGLVSTNDVTLEIWATRRSIQNNARLFDWGNGGYNADPTHYFCLPWYARNVERTMIWTAGKTDSSEIANCFANDMKCHITFTVKQDGTSSKYHLVRRKADDISAKVSVDHTVATWTLSNVVGGRLYLAHSQWNVERDLDANAIYDEVRIWNGVVPDELLGLNAAMGPDTLVLSYDANGKACITIPAGETLPVNANTIGNNYTLAGSVTFGAGAKIEFDTANNPVGMSLTAEGGFTGVTADNIADYVTHTSTATYDLALSGNTITLTLKSSISTAEWIGGTVASVADFADAANWKCWQDDVELSGKTPVVVSEGVATLICPVALGKDADWSAAGVVTLASTIDLNGHNLTSSGFGAAVSILNSGSTATLTLDLAEGVTMDSPAIAGNINIVKNGKGGLSNASWSWGAGVENVFTISEGTYTYSPANIYAGNNGGSMTVLQTGGTVTFGEWLEVGWNSSVGIYKMTGGNLNVPKRRMDLAGGIGNGRGVFDISGSAVAYFVNGTRMAQDSANTTAELYVHDGGRIRTPAIRSYLGTVIVVFDGGIVETVGTSLGNMLNNVPIGIGPKGFTMETARNLQSAPSIISNAYCAVTAPIKKVGAGTYTMKPAKLVLTAGSRLQFTDVSLDLSNATVEVADADNLSTAFVFVESNTAITGTPASGVKGWRVKKSTDGKRFTLIAKGMAIIMK